MKIEDFKIQIQELVDKFESVKSSGKLKNYNEEMTKKDFILPLFRILGWDVENSEEVSAEEKISKGRVDYSFRIGGIPKFFLEAKAIKVDLDKIEFAEQAINYAWHKGTTWAVLTDFEGIKVFNAEWKTANIGQSQLFSLKYHQFVDQIDQLLLLSRKSFEEGAINTFAEKWSKKSKKIPVDKQLLNDLTSFRELLSKNILKNNSSKELSEDDLDEAVQRIIDRLIFIRTLEDKELEPPILRSLIREHSNKKVYVRLNKVFRDIDDIYNSKLFREHLCEQLKIDDEVLEKVIRGLFRSSDNAMQYDFGVIDADVLGNIYEQYLGHILKKTPKRAKLAKGKAHRKEQGIYYTPTYVVDYIVKNTIGELAKDKKIDLKKIKVLDPACGSGSFLMKAFDYLATLDKVKNKNADQTKLDFTTENATYSRKVEILKNNIFGVDLDPKAVEIAQLNLLLKAAEKKHRLPTLQENIKVGNSLIDDPKVAGKRAFKWEEEFKDVLDEGGFDVVIGNPPYIRIQTLENKHVNFFNSNFDSPTKNYDIYILFIEKAFKLLKPGGIVGLILPHKFFQGESGENIRKFISKNKALHKVVDFGTNQVFDGATTYTCLLFLQKKENKIYYYKGFTINENIKNLSNLNFQKFDHFSLNSDQWNFNPKEVRDVLTKIKTSDYPFREITKKIFKGSSTGNDNIFLLDLIEKGKNCSLVFSSAINKKVDIENELLHPFVYGKDVRSFNILDKKKVLLFPYVIEGGKSSLISLDDMKINYPKCFQYLLNLKKELKKRKIEMSEKDFYKYSAARSLTYYSTKKIMIPDMLVENRIALDSGGEYFHGPAIHSLIFNETVKELDLKFFLGILNSSLFWFFITQTSTALRGDAYRLTPEFLSPFCFPKITIKNKAVYEEIVNLVSQIIEMSEYISEDQGNLTDESISSIQKLSVLKKSLDEQVYNLYGLTKKEIKVIEDSLK